MIGQPWSSCRSTSSPLARVCLVNEMFTPALPDFVADPCAAPVARASPERAAGLHRLAVVRVVDCRPFLQPRLLDHWTERDADALGHLQLEAGRIRVDRLAQRGEFDA